VIETKSFWTKRTKPCEALCNKVLEGFVYDFKNKQNYHNEQNEKTTMNNISLN